jgi:H+-translocating NAD(P) transhydrogenase subunit alpha
MDFIAILSIFVLACFVGYYVVWSVTPALGDHRRCADRGG